MPRVTIEELRELLPFLQEEDVSGLRKLLFNHIDIREAIFETMRSPQMTETLRETPIRLLASGEDVNALADGTEIFAGPSRATVVDILGASGYRDDYDRNVLRIRPPGGGADCMFDYLVSDCWATEVAAGRGVEGETVTSRSGCTFIIYSTPQAAIDHWEASSPTRSGIFFVCRGTYNEAIEIATQASLQLHFFGSGRNATIIGGSNGGWTVGSTQVILRDMTVTAASGSRTFTQLAATSNMEIHAYNCITGRALGGDHANSVFIDVQFAAGITFAATDTPQGVYIGGNSDCDGIVDFSTASSAAEWRVYGMRMSSNATLVLNDVTNSYFSLLFQVSTNDQILFSGNTTQVQIDAHFQEMISAGSTVRVATGVTAQNIRIHATFENPGGGTATDTTYIETQGTGNFEASEFLCSFGKVAGNYIEDTGVHVSVNVLAHRCFFALTPTTAEISFQAGSTNNVVASGVVVSSVVGSVIVDAPSDAQYLTLALRDDLTAERLFTPRNNLYVTDAGANGAYTVDSWREGAALAAVFTVLTPGSDGDFFHVNSAATISSIADAGFAGARLLLAFDQATPIVHGASLILQDAANYTTAAGDVIEFVYEGSSVWREISRHTATADHAARHAENGADELDIASLGSGAATAGQVPEADGAGGVDWATPSGAGDVATDAIWDAAGDLAVGTGADTAAALALGAQYTVPTSDGTDLLYKRHFTWQVIAEWYIDGRLRADTTNAQGKVVRLPDYATAALLVEGTSIFGALGTVAAGASLIFDIKHSATYEGTRTSIFETTYPTIAAGDSFTGDGSSNDGTIDTTPTDYTAVDGGFYWLYVRQVGSTAGSEGADLTVQVMAKVYDEY